MQGTVSLTSLHILYGLCSPAAAAAERPAQGWVGGAGAKRLQEGRHGIGQPGGWLPALQIREHSHQPSDGLHRRRKRQRSSPLLCFLTHPNYCMHQPCHGLHGHPLVLPCASLGLCHLLHEHTANTSLELNVTVS